MGKSLSENQHLLMVFHAMDMQIKAEILLRTVSHAASSYYASIAGLSRNGHVQLCRCVERTHSTLNIPRNEFRQGMTRNCPVTSSFATPCVREQLRGSTRNFGRVAGGTVDRRIAVSVGLDCDDGLHRLPR
jgi:hypothetical protein